MSHFQPHFLVIFFLSQMIGELSLSWKRDGELYLFAFVSFLLLTSRFVNILMECVCVIRSDVFKRVIRAIHRG